MYLPKKLGEIIGLQYTVEHNSDRIRHLEAHAIKLTTTLQNLHKHIVRYDNNSSWSCDGQVQIHVDERSNTMW